MIFANAVISLEVRTINLKPVINNGRTNYYVSDDGRVFNSKNKEKAQRINKDGYLKVDLYRNGNRTTERVNRLVATAFIPNPENKPDVNHKDGNKLNNHYSNLEWVTKSENMKHAYQTGLAKAHPTYGMRGHKNPNAGRKGFSIQIVETGETYDNAAKCARAIGGDDRRISDCITGKQKSHRGYHFKRV